MNMRHLLPALIVSTLLSLNPVEAREFRMVAHTVSAGDTMDSIAQTYLPPDRRDSHRAFAEFKEGIFEYNFDTVFSGRIPYDLREGDCLLITFWE